MKNHPKLVEIEFQLLLRGIQPRVSCGMDALSQATLKESLTHVAKDTASRDVNCVL